MAEKSKRNENGDALLEMVMFTPLALLFLFGIVDGGLALTERAAFTDAVRAGIQSELLANVELSGIEIDLQSRSRLSDQAISSTAQGIAQELANSIDRTHGFRPQQTPPPYKVQVIPVILSIDSTDGSYSTHNLRQDLAATTGAAGFEVENIASGFPVTSAQNYIDQTLVTAHQTTTLSPFATPLGSRFLDLSILFYVEVEALTRAVAGSYSEAILGRLYGIQEQELVMLKQQIRW